MLDRALTWLGPCCACNAATSCGVALLAISTGPAAKFFARPVQRIDGDGLARQKPCDIQPQNRHRVFGNAYLLQRRLRTTAGQKSGLVRQRPVRMLSSVSRAAQLLGRDQSAGKAEAEAGGADGNGFCNAASPIACKCRSARRRRSPPLCLRRGALPSPHGSRSSPAQRWRRG